jgi:hypothetical protein
MLLFRSEEEVQAWCERHGRARGAVLGGATLWDLARRWYGDRLDPDWRPRTPAASQAVLASVGLTGDFWRLTPH